MKSLSFDWLRRDKKLPMTYYVQVELDRKTMKGLKTNNEKLKSIFELINLINDVNKGSRGSAAGTSPVLKVVIQGKYSLKFVQYQCPGTCPIRDTKRSKFQREMSYG